MNRPYWHPANIGLAVIALLFTAWEILAAFFFRGQMVTLSGYVRGVVSKSRIAGVGVGAFCIWLLLHFLFGVGP